MACQHENFACEVDVARMPAVEGGPAKRYMADVRVRCADCGQPFRFLGLPMGCDLSGASVSVNGQEARLAILPAGEPHPSDDDAPPGFRILNSGSCRVEDLP